MPAAPQTVDQVRRIDVDQYKYGFVTDIESDKAPKGLSEDIVRFISAKKNEPEWMLAGGWTPIAAGSPCASRAGRG
jgi:Fe-S cluster assembly protein SufB